MNPPRKRGRPPGSKTRPQWLRDRLKEAPKRPRGRPPGAKNRPKTVAEWLAQAADIDKRAVPPTNAHKPCKPRDPNKPKRVYVLKISPEEKRKAQLANAIKGTPPLGIPYGWSRSQYAVVLDQAQKEARKIMEMMENEGMTPDDEMAKAAISAAFTMIGEPLAARDRLAAINTVLAYTKTKPATKTDLTVKTAEDFLDDVANSIK